NSAPGGPAGAGVAGVDGRVGIPGRAGRPGIGSGGCGSALLPLTLTAATPQTSTRRAASVRRTKDAGEVGFAHISPRTLPRPRLVATARYAFSGLSPVGT